MKMKTYYMINDNVDPDSIYGSDYPVCLDAAEVKRLGAEWGANLFDQMHEATTEEIEKYGVYNCEKGLIE